MNPLRNNLSILPEPILMTNNFGIIVTATPPKFRTGTVVSVGPEVESVINAGDKCMYIDRHAVQDGDNHIVSEDHIECIL